MFSCPKFCLFKSKFWAGKTKICYHHLKIVQLKYNNDTITSGNTVRALINLSIPMLINAVLQNIQTLIDLFWVGKLGSIAIASVATSGTILMILFPIVVGISSGTIAIVSRYIGSKNYDFANHVVGQSLFLLS
ncbi:hypothetical protein B9J78_03320 [bacterium Unc6]|nr:hypothetical protein [bacterium Unc6]